MLMRLRTELQERATANRCLFKLQKPRPETTYDRAVEKTARGTKVPLMTRLIGLTLWWYVRECVYW